LQHGTDRVGLALQEVAQPLGHREHPLAHRQGREDVIDKMRGGFGHAPGAAGGADAAPLAGEGQHGQRGRPLERSSARGPGSRLRPGSAGPGQSRPIVRVATTPTPPMGLRGRMHLRWTGRRRPQRPLSESRLTGLARRTSAGRGACAPYQYRRMSLPYAAFSKALPASKDATLPSVQSPQCTISCSSVDSTSRCIRGSLASASER
jgi:hypothetical protein